MQSSKVVALIVLLAIASASVLLALLLLRYTPLTDIEHVSVEAKMYVSGSSFTVEAVVSNLGSRMINVTRVDVIIGGVNVTAEQMVTVKPGKSEVLYVSGALPSSVNPHTASALVVVSYCGRACGTVQAVAKAWP